MREQPGSVYQRKSDGRWVAAVSIGPRGARHTIVRYGKTAEQARTRLDEIAKPFDRVWQRVIIGPGCWLWSGRHTSNGRALVDVDGHGTNAARVVWEAVNGPILDGLHVLHHCDNPPCVRPDHLFLGTAQDNVDDMIAKGRAGWQNASQSPVTVTVTTSSPGDADAST